MIYTCLYDVIKVKCYKIGLWTKSFHFCPCYIIQQNRLCSNILLFFVLSYLKIVFNICVGCCGFARYPHDPYHKTTTPCCFKWLKYLLLDFIFLLQKNIIKSYRRRQNDWPCNIYNECVLNKINVALECLGTYHEKYDRQVESVDENA